MAGRRIKEVIEKDPSSYSLITYAWVMLLSVWGGVVNFIRRVRTGQGSSYLPSTNKFSETETRPKNIALSYIIKT